MRLHHCDRSASIRVRCEHRIRRAARLALGHVRSLQTDFEHGQWWVTDRRTGAQWAVCDVEPGSFCFEQVTEGEER